MKNNHHSPRRLTALLLVVASILSLFPSAFSAHLTCYHTPAEHWPLPLTLTVDLSANSVVPLDTFACGI